MGLLLLSHVGQHASYFPSLFVLFTIMGLGMPVAMMPLLTIAISDVPREDAGLASGIVNAFLQLAGASACPRWARSPPTARGRCSRAARRR